MAQFKITKKVDFGPYTITGPTGGQLDNVPLNNYAPKIGDIIKGDLVTKPINDGNGHTEIKTGIVWSIMTNGSASTQGQTSIQFISQDFFEPYPLPDNGNAGDDNSTPHPIDPANNTDNNPAPSNEGNTSNGTGEENCWICENKIPVLIAILILIGLVFVFNND